MKQILITWCAFVMSAWMVSCTSPKHRAVVSDVVAIDLPLQRGEHLINLSEVADSVHYIPLETNDSCLIGSIDKLLLTEEGCFIVVDKEIASAVYVFGADGRFLNRIGSRGQGYGEYIHIEDVTCGNGYVYVWDSNLNKVLKYSEQGEPVDEYKFEYTAYSMYCMGEDLLAFGCDYTPNPSLRHEDAYPSLLLYDAASDSLRTALYFDEAVNSAGYLTTLNNLAGGNLYLPLNDTLYVVDKTGVSAHYVLNYAERYAKNKEEYVRRCRTEPMTADAAEEDFNQGAYPHLITYLGCDSVSLLFMRMQEQLYYGFYYPHTGTYKEASSSRQWPVVNDLDNRFLFSPRCVEGNRAFCVAEPSVFLKDGEDSMPIGEEDNPIIVEVFLKTILCSL